ncbi:MAG: PAS domain S-box protein [Flavobacteriales bacterium]|nr:PAS domain S-box protein [Flavobacteriales bacterium]
MNGDNLNTELLLELAISQSIRTGSDDEILEVCDMYMQKLKCFGVALYDNDSLKFVRPAALVESPIGERMLSAMPAQSEGQENSPFYFESNGDLFYVLSLSDYGRMVLLRKSPIGAEFLLQLNRLTLKLGKDLSRFGEKERLGPMLRLFDRSSDAIHVYEESGRLIYTNLPAAARSGIDRNKVSDYSINDFEALFIDPDRWQAHLGELKDKGQVVLERVSIDQSTGEEIPAEVTTCLIKVDGKSFVVTNARDISSRKKQERELNRTSAKLESILNEMSEVVWSIGVPNYEILFVSPSVEDMYEIPAREWLRDSTLWERVIHPDDRDVKASIFDQLDKTGRYNVTYRILTPTGKTKWAQNKGKYIYGTGGSPERIDGIVKDITEQQLIQEKEYYYLNMQQTLIDVAVKFINTDTEHTNSTINDSLEKMGLLVSADRAYVFDYDFVNDTVSNTHEWCREGIVPEIDNLQDVPIELFPSWLERHKKNEALYIPDVSKLDPITEGGLRSILEPQGIKSLLALPVSDGNELIGFVGFDSVERHREFSESEQRLLFLFSKMLINARNRSKWERQLRIQEEKYRNILANMNLGLLEVDMDDNIVYANESFCRMAGYTFSDLKGNRASDLLLEEHAKEVLAGKFKDRLNGISSSYELKITDNAGNEKTWLVSGAPNFNDEGKLVGSIGVHLDISAQKMLERQLSEAKFAADAAGASKERFLANMSHEIRTPLNIIIGMIRELSKEKLTSDQHFYVRESKRSADHLLALVNDLLDITKIESGDMEIVHEPFNLAEVTDSAYALMKGQAMQKGLDFQLRLDPRIRHELEGDATRLKQILINLLDNAFKFTDYGSVSLSIKLLKESVKHQRLYFEVTDTGIGMSKAYLSKVFLKFSQERTSAHQMNQGSGLGMSISNDLVQLMGGEMHVKSEKHKGTAISFVLSFPFGKPTANVQSRDIEANEFQNLKALVVEDNAMNRLIAVKSLEYLGIQSKEAENGKIAVEILRKHRFDLILMDIQMPVMNGLDATRVIRNSLKLRIPIIALTANAFKKDREDYLSFGMNAYIPKPYNEKVFFSTIKETLTAARLLTEGEGPLTDVSPEKVSDVRPLYSLRILEGMGRGKSSFTAQITKEFIDMATVNIDSLQLALRKKDLETIRDIAHKIKPSIDVLEIDALKKTVRKVENHNLGAGLTDDLAVSVNQIIAVLGEVIAHLQK